MAITTSTTSVSVSRAGAVAGTETCPLCGTDEVRVDDVAWFAVQFDRRAEIDVEDAVVFLCRECGVNWD
jgi:predicted RNA-binding Zn-ribbon protein involved in translation (DUF1610 family)